MVRKICTYLCDDAYGVFSYYGDNNFIHGNFPPCVVPSAYCDLDPSGLRSLPEHMDPGERELYAVIKRKIFLKYIIIAGMMQVFFRSISKICYRLMISDISSLFATAR